MRKSSRTIWLSVLALLLSPVAGCAPFKLPENIVLPGQEEKLETPMRMTALWTNTVLVESGVVGFGGRLMFYGTDGEEPIEVDGELTVFAYDDTDDVKEDRIPARKFVFRTEDFSRHYSESRLGHSYSFWVPWGQVGGMQRQVSLIARFKSAGGGVVMSEMTRHLLPGSQHPAVSTPAPAVSPKSPVQAAAHHQPIVSNSQRAGMSTTTITLPEASGAAAYDAGTVDALLEQASALQTGAPSGTAVPSTTATPANAAVTSPSATSSDLTEIRALVREAVQDALESEEGTQRPDRFGRLRRRARIAPKLPPTRDPEPSALHPAGLRSGL
jgi:hypothetical protein